MRKGKLIIAGAILFAFMMLPVLSFAADVGDLSQQKIGNITVMASKPHINSYIFYDNAAPAANLTNTAIDVKNVTYGFGMHISNQLGIAELTVLNIYMWYDFGDDLNAYGANPGAYWNFLLQYDFATQTVSVMEGEVYLESVDPEIEANVLAGSLDLDILFHMTGFTRWAPGDGTNDLPPAGSSKDTTAFNDADSWNFHLELFDAYGNSDNRYDEFYTYKYSKVTLYNQDISGGGAPGQPDVSLGANNLWFQTNAPHKFQIQMNDDALLGGVGPELIPATDFSLSGYDLAAESFFGGIGAGNEILILGDAGNYRIQADPLYGNLSAVAGDTWDARTANYIDYGPLFWEVDIPGGISEGQYDTDYTLDIVTGATPVPGPEVAYGTPLP